MSFVHTEHVRFGDLDAMRHLNNVVFLRYFETARIAYLKELVPGRRSSFRVEFEMRVEGRLAAEGYGVLVGFDYVGQQAAALPEALRERLESEVTAAT
jgi:acyl-CoA thioester hydrolase